MDAAAPTVEQLLAHAAWTRALARELVGDADLAEELAQETLTAALEHPPEQRDRARGWLAQVLRNRWLQRLRRENVRRRLEPLGARDEAQPSTLELVERADTLRHVAQVVLELDEPYRRSVLLRWFEGLAPREIAARERVPLATVTSRLTRAHAQLRERLDREHGGDGRRWILVLAPYARELRPMGAVGAGGWLMAGAAKWAAAVLVVGALALWWGTRERPDAEQVARVDEVAAPTDERDPQATAAERAQISAPQQVLEPPPSSTPSEPAPALQGVVLDPSGAPAADAEVVTAALEVLAFEKRPASVQSTRTDELGRFRFERIEGGAVRLSARKAGSAASDTLGLRLSGAVSGVELRLRRGARVEGEVLAPDARPAPGRKVTLARDGGGGSHVLQADEQGRFAVDNVVPGRWSIYSMPSKDELVRLGLEGQSDYSYLRQSMFELADGEQRFVTLGAPPRQAVRVSGRVTQGGAPRQVLIQWLGESSRSLELQRVANSDADGRYEVEFAEPGAYLGRVGDPKRGDFSADTLLEIPADAREWVHDIELPSGVVRGVVVDSAGQPLKGMLVRPRCERGPWRAQLTAMLDQGLTGDDGAFAFTGLRAGRWSFSVGGDWLADGGPLYPAQTLSGSIDVAEGATHEGLRIEVPQAPALRGRCVDELGLGAGDAGIVVHLADGRALRGYSKVTANGTTGAFAGPALGPGAMSVMAIGRTTCSAPVWLDADPAQRGELELVVRPGAFVVVRFSGVREGWAASVELRDGARRSFKDVWPATGSQLDFLASFRPGVQRFGPVPPGSYTLEVVRADGTLVQRELTLAAGETREIRF